MKILFLCVANSARSQMAEGFARAIYQKGVEIESAGSQPSGLVHPFAVWVMKEVGIDISKHHSKGWDRLPQAFLSELDFVITLCREECPNIPTKATKQSWGINDPASAVGTEADLLEAFRNARNEIRGRIEDFGRKFELLYL